MPVVAGRETAGVDVRVVESAVYDVSGAVL